VDSRQFFAASAVTIVAGKGGVGKTTVAATMALAAARCGLRVTIIEVEGKSGLSALFGADSLSYEDQLLWKQSTGPGSIRGRALRADHALVDYLRDHGLTRISRRLADSGALDIVTAATPGIKDVLVLGKIKQLERSGTSDLIIVDAPAADGFAAFIDDVLDAIEREDRLRHSDVLLEDARVLDRLVRAAEKGTHVD